MGPWTIAVLFMVATLLAMLVRTLLRVPPRLVPGNLDFAHVPTPLDRDAALDMAATLTLFPIVRHDEKRGLLVLDVRSRAIAEKLTGGKRVRTFGYWVVLVFRALPEQEGSDVAVGVQRKWLEFGAGSVALRKAVRDATVRELWTKLPPPPRT